MKKLASLLAAIAVLATGAASMGSVWFLSDEPTSCGMFND